MSRVSGHSIGKQSRRSPAALTHGRLLDQVAGQQHVRVGHPDHQVAAGVAASRVHQLDHPVAEVERDGGGERRVGRHDLGRLHLLAVRVVEVVRFVVDRLDPLAGRDGVLGGHLVRMHGDRAVLRQEGAVAEGVVEVLVGVHDRDHLAGAERADVLDHLAGGDGRGVGVDDEQAGRPADQRDVDVEPLVASDPDVVGDLGERHPPV